MNELNVSSEKLNKRSFTVDLLTIFFGIGTWIGVNGTFIQTPLLVNEAPEGWALPSYLVVMVQIGNLGPILYALLQKLTKNKVNDAYLIYGLLAMGTVTALLTAFFYNKTAFMFGSNYSVALFVLTIFTAINGCSSNVVFMPYMGRFKQIYLVTYFIGEGLSGLLPSIVALIQGIGADGECRLLNVTESGEEIYEKYSAPPRFGSMEFFLFVFAMMFLSFIGFWLLDQLKLSKKEYAQMTVGFGNNYVYNRKSSITASSSTISGRQSKLLLGLICVICFFSNGVMNSIQTYCCLPYGGNTYHLCVTLSVIANPVACFIYGIFPPLKSMLTIVILSLISALLLIYTLVIAVMSPNPPMITSGGSILIILIWTLLVSLISYIKLAIATVMRSQGGKSLVYTGSLTQIGSAFGSIIIFILINFSNIFEAAPPQEC